jgi:predicted RNA-binding protein with PUA-like domain
MRTIKIGDKVFLFSLKKLITGIVQVIAEAHPDSTTGDSRGECLDIKAVTALGLPITLKGIKSHT